MGLGIEQNAASLYALEQRQALIANNLACSAVNGYREKTGAVKGTHGGKIKFSDLKPVDMSTPTISVKVNEKQGPLENTKVPTDVAINGTGFFKVKDNNDMISFTRNGSFHFDSSGILCDIQGRFVDGDSGKIQAENNGDPIFINSNGKIFEGDQEIGTLIAFELPENIKFAPNVKYKETDLVNAKKSESASFTSGYLEHSNVSPIMSMVDMIKVSNAYETNMMMIKQLDTELGEAIQVLGTING